MRFLGQKAQDSVAEQDYSLVGSVQSNNRGRMQPKSAEIETVLFSSRGALRDCRERGQCPRT